MPNVYTYTHTLTKQEEIIRDLNEQVFKEIEASFEGNANAKYSYKAIAEDGRYLDEKPMNLYDEGVLVSDDFQIYKMKGLTGFAGVDLNYIYKSEEGEIHSFGRKYDSSFISFPGGITIKLTEFDAHPEAEEFLEKVIKKISRTEEEKTPQL